MSQFENRLCRLLWVDGTEPLLRAGPLCSRPCMGGPQDPVGPCDTSAVVLYSFLYVVVRFLLETLIVRSRSEARLRAEVLALRHQLAVLERQVAGLAGSRPMAWCWLRSAVSC